MTLVIEEVWLPQVAVTQTGETITQDVWGCSHFTHKCEGLPAREESWAGSFLSLSVPSLHSLVNHCPVAMNDLWKSEVAPLREDHFCNKVKPRNFSSWGWEGDSPSWSKDSVEGEWLTKWGSVSLRTSFPSPFITSSTKATALLCYLTVLFQKRAKTSFL